MWAFGHEYLSLNISNTLALGMGLNSGLDYIYCAWILNGGCSPIAPLFMGDSCLPGLPVFGFLCIRSVNKYTYIVYIRKH